MGDEYLAIGFTDVDGTGNTDAYSQCLSLLDSLPYYRECKSRGYELLDLKPGSCSEDDSVGWIRELIERTAKGSFEAVLTAYTVVGRKPAG